jgi:hypothetical protein
MSYEQSKIIVLESLRNGERVNELTAYQKNIYALSRIIKELRAEGYILTSKPFLGKDNKTWFHDYKLSSVKQESIFA